MAFSLILVKDASQGNIYVFEATLHPRIKNSESGGPGNVCVFFCVCFLSEMYSIDGRSDLLREAIGPEGSDYFSTRIHTRISKEIYSHL